MRWFYNMRISTKLISGFVIVALMAAVVGVVGLKNINEMDQKIH